MQESPAVLEKLDHQILAALQIWPRVSWANLGAVLNVDPVTASRRWARMYEAGIAWFSAYSSVEASAHKNKRAESVGAVVELQVRPKELDRVFEQLQDNPELMTLRATLGEWNTTLEWRGPNYDGLTDFANNQVSHVKGVRATRSFASVQVVIDGSSWTYDGLSVEQENRLKRIQRDDLADPTPFADYWHPIDSSILKLIRTDARMSYTEMARRTDSVVATVKRHLSHMIRNRDLIIRCDLSRPHSTRPVTVRYFATIPVTGTAETFARLAEFPDIRSCSVLLGRYNLIMNVWLESVHDTARFEAALAQRIPSLRIEERDLVTRFYRHLGHRIDEDGLNYSDPQT